MRRLLLLAVSTLLLGGCVTLPFMQGDGSVVDEVPMSALSPVDRGLIGKWRVSAQFPFDAGMGDNAMIGKVVKLQEQMATDLPGRRCSSATLGMSRLMLPDGGRYGAAARGLLAAEGSAPLLVVRCGSRAFGDYLVRPDGTLLARYADGYALLTRDGGMGMMGGSSSSKPRKPVALHLSSEISPEAAKMEWRRLKREFSMLKQLSPKYHSLDVPGKGHFVRVYAIGEGGKARRICKALKKKGQYCGVMPIPK